MPGNRLLPGHLELALKKPSSLLDRLWVELPKPNQKDFPNITSSGRCVKG
jgi:hypothetical protein